MSFRSRRQHVVEHVRRLKHVPLDLLAILCVLVLYVLTLVTSPAGGVLRALLGLFIVAFAPGYLLVVALAPGAGESLARSWHERSALALGCSFLLTPVAVLVVDTLGVPFGSTSFRAAVVVALLVGVVVAGYRRLSTPPGQRLTVSVPRLTASSIRDRLSLVRVGLVVAVVIASTTLGYALVAPQDGDHTTTLSVLTRDESGDLVAGDYPGSIAETESEPLIVAVRNNEDRQTTYTVAVELQQVADDGETVTEDVEIDRRSRTVDPGEQWQYSHSPTAATTGERLRLVYTLYRGDAPANVSRQSAYRSVYLWIDASSSGG